MSITNILTRTQLPSHCGLCCSHRMTLVAERVPGALARAVAHGNTAIVEDRALALATARALAVLTSRRDRRYATLVIHLLNHCALTHLLPCPECWTMCLM